MCSAVPRRIARSVNAPLFSSVRQPTVDLLPRHHFASSVYLNSGFPGSLLRSKGLTYGVAPSCLGRLTGTSSALYGLCCDYRHRHVDMRPFVYRLADWLRPLTPPQLRCGNLHAPINSTYAGRR